MLVRSYDQRLSIPLSGEGMSTKFFSRTGVHIATGYTRVVIGDRGPYVEFRTEQLKQEAMREVDAAHYYYVELRSVPDDIKVYVQVHKVDYADYEPGMCYISPFDLVDEDRRPFIEPLRRS